MEVHKILSGIEEGMVRSMAGIPVNDEIPAKLLERLAQHKKMINRVDGRLVAGVVAEILIGMDFTMPVVEEVPVEVETAEVVEPEVEEVVEPETFEDETEPGRDFIPDGVTVSFTRDGEKQTGEIQDHQVYEEDIFYNIAVDGEEGDIPVMLAEDEIEVV